MIHEILTKSSADFPQKEAIVCGDNRISYKELNKASTILANFLRSHGVSYQDRVGIFTNKNIEETIAIFAILKMGGIFVHINPQLKESQLSHVISDCDIKALFVNDYKSTVLNKAYPEVSPIDLVISLSSKLNLNKDVFKNIRNLDDILKEPSPDKISSDKQSEDDIASIIYTSGSTGMPKGVIVTHKILHDSTVISASILENNHDDRLICVTPFSFDGALSQLFTSCYVGGTLVQQQSNFPKDIVNTMLNEKITGFHAMPSLWSILLQKHSPFAKYDYPDLRYISIIGEVFPQNHLDNLRMILNKTKFYMMYGTTEAFRSTYLPPEDFERKKSSAGIPFPGVDISIVDEQNNICQPGETGEIIHKGVFVSPGYWNDSDKTAETFKDGSLYTGDLGKLDQGGYLYFMGRKDSMIKTQGFRVSPEEIEECIFKVDGVKEVAVIGVSGNETGVRIKAIIVCKEGYILTDKDIISHCRNRLPNYMVPGIVEFRSDLPRTATNKINRSELC